eukprot:3999708-Alexandrium_andersonii.AAC.1
MRERRLGARGVEGKRVRGARKAAQTKGSDVSIPDTKGRRQQSVRRLGREVPPAEGDTRCGRVEH